MVHEDMTDDERALLEHRWAVRVNLPTDVMHAAQLARRALEVAAYARLELPGQDAVVQAVETLEGWAVAIDQRVKAERTRRVLSGMDDAQFQRELERVGLQQSHDAAEPEQSEASAVHDHEQGDPV